MATDSFDKLKINRKTLRTSVTKLINSIDNLIKTAPIDFVILEENMQQLKIKANNLLEVDKELEPLIPLNEYETEKNASYDYSDKINLAIFRAEKKLKENTVLNTGIDSSNEKVNVCNEKKFVKLPKIRIPVFTGDCTQFTSFWNTFKVTIHENGSLSKVEKFNYLKSYLSSTALNAIEGLEISETNYDAAINILSIRFGQKNMIINHHMNKLLNLSPVYKSSDIFRLKKLHEEIEINTRSLSALGLEEESYSAMLIAIILKILPSDLALEWNRKNADNVHNTNIKDLLNFIQLEIFSRERTFGTKNKTFDQNKNKTIRDMRAVDTRAPRMSSAHEFIAAAVKNESTNKKCIFCKSGLHDSEYCDKYDIEKRKNILKSQGRCYSCLLPRHRIKECPKNINCRVCGLKHHEAICFKMNNSQNKEKILESKITTGNSSEIVSAVSHVGRNSVFLQTCCVKLKNKKNEMISRLLLDCGSMRTFLCQNIVDKLNLNTIRREKLSVFTFGCKTPIQKTYDVVKLLLVNKNSNDSSIEIEALVTDEICCSDIPPPPDLNKITKNKYLLNLTLSDSPTCEKPISLLIGADYYYNIVLGNLKRINKDLVAVQTIFGWCLQGVKGENKNSINMNIIVEEGVISEQIQKFWDLETSGLINLKEDFDYSENTVLKKFESEIKYKDKRYEVTLPWKLDKENLHDNRKIAESRFLRLKKRFCKNPDLFFEYRDVLLNYLNDGIIEPVLDNNPDCISFYLPHREVIKRDRETSKLRIVFDASAHDSDCISLNSCLNIGPNLYEDIFCILCRFRFHPVAFTADMKQAFLQIVVDETDRDVTRFLFCDDPFEDFSSFQTFRFTRVLFGLNCSPFLLAATIKHHLKKFNIVYPETVNFLSENIYVDDIIGSHPSLEKALSTSLQSIEIFKDASMQLHKWHTNSNRLHELWIKNGVVPQNSKCFEENSSPNKVLGLGWNNLEDTLYFDARDLTDFVSKNVDTKRFVLQALGRIFDPLGFLGPFTVRIKCLMQRIWSSGLDWDDPLPDDLKSLWKSWCKEVFLLTKFSIPRFLFAEIPDFEINDLQLHFFADSSMKALGTVAYFRAVNSREEIRTVFIASKNRVAPLKSLTLPKLELTAALLSAKLCGNILKALKINVPCFFWTDSKIVYYWVKGTPEKFKPFVKNRVAEIQNLTSPSNWYHCPGADNPADLVSRGAKVTKLLNEPNWLLGPKWLSLPRQFWPKFYEEEIDENELEFTKKSKEILQNACVIEELENPIEITKFSSFEKLVRVTALVKRFISKLKKCNTTRGPLTAEELTEAENYLINSEQKKFYKNEIQSLKNGNQVDKNSPLYNFVPYIDEHETLRLGGRLEFSNLSLEEKHPIILSKHSWLTILIVRKHHEQMMHAGTAMTLSKIRSKYWIPKGRQLVKGIIKKCLICKKYFSKPADQITAPLPGDRVTESPPFSVCGLDHAGPIYVKNSDKLQKSYILLITCAVTRSIHLELVSDMTTDSFLLAFRRFLSRRLNCKVIYSDNAKTFKKAKQEIDNLYDIISSNQVLKFLAEERIVWKNILEKAAWWGGFYERLVKSVKECLRKIIGKALLNYEEMSTVLVEVEAILNLRPLTYVYNENEEPEPLTPMNFLNFGKKISLPVNFFDMIENGSKRSSLLKRRRYQSLLLRQIWTKWKNLYLLDLKTAHFRKNPTPHVPLKVGDVVLIEDNNKNKFLWKLGRIQKVIPGRDKNIRSYEIKTVNGVLKRTIQHLYPLEIQSDEHS